MKIVYKIRRKTDGLFSTGGYSPSFSKKGKTWNSKNALHNHLNLEPTNTGYTYTSGPFGGVHGTTRDAYVDCELVEIEITDKEIGSMGMVDYREVRRKAEAARLAKRGITRTRIQKCPTCSQPVNTHLCGLCGGVK